MPLRFGENFLYKMVEMSSLFPWSALPKKSVCSVLNGLHLADRSGFPSIHPFSCHVPLSDSFYISTELVLKGDPSLDTEGEQTSSMTAEEIGNNGEYRKCHGRTVTSEMWNGSD